MKNTYDGRMIEAFDTGFLNRVFCDFLVVRFSRKRRAANWILRRVLRVHIVEKHGFEVSMVSIFGLAYVVGLRLSSGQSEFRRHEKLPISTNKLCDGEVPTGVNPFKKTTVPRVPGMKYTKKKD